jgi:hypothetical protein
VAAAGRHGAPAAPGPRGQYILVLLAYRTRYSTCTIHYRDARARASVRAVASSWREQGTDRNGGWRAEFLFSSVDIDIDIIQ